VRGVVPSRVDMITKCFEDLHNLWIAIKFTALIKIDIFVFDIRRVFFEPMDKPIERGSLQDPRGTFKGTRWRDQLVKYSRLCH
jgi:hypothetical protein